MKASSLKPKLLLPEILVPDLLSLETFIEEYQRYIAKKGFETRKVSYLKKHMAKFLIANQNISTLDITPDKYIECLEIKFKEINKKEVVLNPGHLSSALAKDYVREKLSHESDGVLLSIEAAAKLVAQQNKFVKTEDDDRFVGLRSKVTSGTASPWELFYYKARAIQVSGVLPEWIKNAEVKMKEAYHGKTKQS